jgi:hypothetical protein
MVAEDFVMVISSIKYSRFKRTSILCLQFLESHLSNISKQPSNLLVTVNSSSAFAPKE